MSKKPNSFMNVPSSATTSGTPSTMTSRSITSASAGHRQAPSACGRFWNWPVIVVNRRPRVSHCWASTSGSMAARVTTASAVAAS